MLKTLALALLLLTLPGCYALKARQVALPSELTTPAPEPLAPSPLTVNNSEFAAYSIALWFWGRGMAEQLQAIEALQHR